MKYFTLVLLLIIAGCSSPTLYRYTSIPDLQLTIPINIDQWKNAIDDYGLLTASGHVIVFDINNTNVYFENEKHTSIADIVSCDGLGGLCLKSNWFDFYIPLNGFDNNFHWSWNNTQFQVVRKRVVKIFDKNIEAFLILGECTKCDIKHVFFLYSIDEGLLGLRFKL